MDYEESHFYIVEISACNIVSREYCSSAIIRVEVVDENDESPQFIFPEMDFSVHENAVPGTHVGQVTARDKDHNSQVS